MTASDKRNLIFAADLGGTHLRAATVDQDGKIQFRFKQNTPQAATLARLLTPLLQRLMNAGNKAIVMRYRRCRWLFRERLKLKKAPS